MNESTYVKNLLLGKICEDCKWSKWYPGISGRPGLCGHPLTEEKPLVGDFEICDKMELRNR